ncbi:XRE family transcriptional regulator [Streptomyces sp. NBC_00390]|uniref:helix-turn-helix domain-containing protein n=1 Tax=unclassified Streptomyces TaxID=2593676 RepID=UPI002E1D0BC9
MPRWKELPAGLDPEVREFTGQLRGVVDRSGLSIAAISDRTGFSKTSWERYLNGRLLAPKRAIVALAEVTGIDTGHITTMWELAERAWSRSEMRHDMTMEAIRISQARAALGEFGPGAEGAAASGSRASRSGAAGERGGRAAFVPPQGGAPGHQATPTASGGRGAASARRGGKGQGKSKGFMFAAALVGALLVVAGAVYVADLGGGGDEPGRQAVESPTPTPVTSGPELPAGVKCSGADCAGEDPELMGCGGELAKTVATATVGKAVVEVRYSKTCGAAWARITKAAVGDTVQITVAGKGEQNGLVNADLDAYTPMAAAPDPADAKACATLKAGTTGCTTGQ